MESRLGRPLVKIYETDSVTYRKSQEQETNQSIRFKGIKSHHKVDLLSLITQMKNEILKSTKTI